MSTTNPELPTQPLGALGAPGVPAGPAPADQSLTQPIAAQSVPAAPADQTLVPPKAGSAPLVPEPPPFVPPPPPPPTGGGGLPPAAGPTPSPQAGSNFSLPLLLGIFVIALLGIGLLGVGLYAVVKLTSNAPAAVSAATRVPLITQAVLVPTTTLVPTLAHTATPLPSATARPATATSTLVATTAPVTATSGLSATVTLTSTAVAGGEVVTITQGANVRTGPGISYPAIGGIKQGDTAPVLGRDATGSWYEISYKGGLAGLGWISAVTASYAGNKSVLPVVAAPPTPVPTATPKPAGNPNGGLVNGTHGVSGMLNLCSSQVVFAVNERVCFVEWIKNNTNQTVPYGILGVTAIRAGGGTQFQTSWSGQDAVHGLLAIDAGCTGPTDRCKGQWEDGIRLGSAGSYQLFLNVCFSDYPTCRGTSGDWEVLSGSIHITVQ
jgi:uncharacterized protein YraI